MSTARKPSFYTPQEYLARERLAQSKSEYLDGRIHAMAGASRVHSLIAMNLGAELRQRLRESPCEVHGSDLRVLVDETGLFTYPDVTVVCGEPKFFERSKLDTLVNPKVIFEVLSPSTEAYDRGGKFGHYRRVASLREYVVVSQERMLVEWFCRGDDGAWVLREARGAEGVLRLDSLGCEVPLSGIYERVNFEEAEKTPVPEVGVK